MLSGDFIRKYWYKWHEKLMRTWETRSLKWSFGWLSLDLSNHFLVFLMSFFCKKIRFCTAFDNDLSKLIIFVENFVSARFSARFFLEKTVLLISSDLISFFSSEVNVTWLFSFEESGILNIEEKDLTIKSNFVRNAKDIWYQARAERAYDCAVFITLQRKSE